MKVWVCDDHYDPEEMEYPIGKNVLEKECVYCEKVGTHLVEK